MSDKQAVFAEMAKRSVVHAVVEFSGGGDEGGADQIRLRFADGHEEDLDPYTHDDALSEALSDIPHWEYGSFAGDFSVSGTFTVDAATRRISMGGDESAHQPVSKDW